MPGAFTPSILEAEAGLYKVEASQSYKVRSCLKKKKKKGKYTSDRERVSFKAQNSEQKSLKYFFLYEPEGSALAL